VIYFTYLARHSLTTA